MLSWNEANTQIQWDIIDFVENSWPSDIHVQVYEKTRSEIGEANNNIFDASEMCFLRADTFSHWTNIFVSMISNLTFLGYSIIQHSSFNFNSI